MLLKLYISIPHKANVFADLASFVVYIFFLSQPTGMQNIIDLAELLKVKYVTYSVPYEQEFFFCYIDVNILGISIQQGKLCSFVDE